MAGKAENEEICTDDVNILDTTNFSTQSELNADADDDDNNKSFLNIIVNSRSSAPVDYGHAVSLSDRCARQNSKIKCCINERDVSPELPEFGERANMIAQSVWVVIYCITSAIYDIKEEGNKNTLLFEENVALCAAVDKGEMNVIYLLGHNVSRSAARGFPVVLGNNSWADEVIECVVKRPEKFNSKMYRQYCYCHAALQESYLSPFRDLVEVFYNTHPDKGKESILITWSISKYDGNAQTVSMTAIKDESGDITFQSKRSGDIDWKSANNIDPEMPSGTKKARTINAIAVGFYLFLIVGSFGVWVVSILPFFTEFEDNNHIKNLQIAFLLACIILLSLNAFLSQFLMSIGELLWISGFQATVAVISLIVQIIFQNHNQPDSTDVSIAVNVGALICINWLNVIVLCSHLFDSGSNKWLKLFTKIVTILAAIGLFLVYCCFLPRRFKEKCVSMRSNLFILFVLYICLVGSFMCIAKHLRQFLRSQLNKCRHVNVSTRFRVFESALFLIFMMIWLGPSYATYGFDTQMGINCTTVEANSSLADKYDHIYH